MGRGLAQAGLGPQRLPPDRPPAALLALAAHPDGDVLVLVRHAEGARAEVLGVEVGSVDDGLAALDGDVAGDEEGVALAVAEPVSCELE